MFLFLFSTILDTLTHFLSLFSVCCHIIVNKEGLSTNDCFTGLTHSTVPISAFEGGVKKQRFLQQHQDTEFIEVQGQP